MRSGIVAAPVLLGLALCACVAGRKAATGFHMPDGDVEKGRAAFTDLRCHGCHQVIGERFPASTADPPVPVTLGGVVTQERTDGELVAAIIDPSHRLVGYPEAAVRSGSLSRMGDFSESMTVRQLEDLVAFLHSRYEVRPPPPAMH